MHLTHLPVNVKKKNSCGYVILYLSFILLAKGLQTEQIIIGTCSTVYMYITLPFLLVICSLYFEMALNFSRNQVSLPEIYNNAANHWFSTFHLRWHTQNPGIHYYETFWPKIGQNATSIYIDIFLLRHICWLCLCLSLIGTFNSLRIKCLLSGKSYHIQNQTYRFKLSLP